MKPTFRLSVLLVIGALVTLTTTAEAQTVGRVRKSLDKATGGATSGSQPAAPVPAVDPQAAAKAQAQAAANKALYDKRNKAAQVGADQRVVDFLKQRIEGGSADAAFDLGKRYEEGKGVVADPVEARKLYQLAAERGNEDAKKWLEEHPQPKTKETATEQSPAVEKLAPSKAEPKPAGSAPPPKKSSN